MNLKLFAAVLLHMLLSASACAGEVKAQHWEWYYSAFESTRPTSSVMVRSGTAEVTVAKGQMKITFAEPRLAELRATFEGKNSKSQSKFVGELKGFFLEGTEPWKAAHSKERTEEGCEFEEIILRHGFPDGSLIVLRRVSGPCVVESPD